MVIILNPKAGAGQALRKWRRIERWVLKQFPESELFILNGKNTWGAFLHRKIVQGHRQFIAAGGDGTVHWLLQELGDRFDVHTRQQLKIGAIGLGSSNDFHKPFEARRFLKDVPVKMDFTSAAFQDVGQLTFEDETGNRQRRYWINNASMGITAEANAFFNSPDALLNALKKHATPLAILYAALHTIFSYQNKTMHIRFAQEPPKNIRVTNLGVVKNPHFSGNFCYDSPFETASGFFYVHLCYDMSRLQTLKTLRRLAKAQFSGFPHTVGFRLNDLEVRANHPFAVEYDGETVQTRRAQFSVKKQWIRVCQK